MSNAQIPKFRPVLTGPQIAYLLELCQSDERITPEGEQCIAILSVFQLKASLGATKPAYSSTYKPSLEETFSAMNPIDQEENRYLRGEMSVEEATEYEARLISGKGTEK